MRPDESVENRPDDTTGTSTSCEYPASSTAIRHDVWGQIAQSRDFLIYTYSNPPDGNLSGPVMATFPAQLWQAFVGLNLHTDVHEISFREHQNITLSGMIAGVNAIEDVRSLFATCCFHVLELRPSRSLVAASPSSVSLAPWRVLLASVPSEAF